MLPKLFCIAVASQLIIFLFFLNRCISHQRTSLCDFIFITVFYYYYYYLGKTLFAQDFGNCSIVATALNKPYNLIPIRRMTYFQQVCDFIFEGERASSGPLLGQLQVFLRQFWLLFLLTSLSLHLFLCLHSVARFYIRTEVMNVLKLYVGYLHMQSRLAVKSTWRSRLCRRATMTRRSRASFTSHCSPGSLHK